MRYLQLGRSNLRVSAVSLSTRGVERLLRAGIQPTDLAAR
jgi:hypothetical protein